METEVDADYIWYEALSKFIPGLIRFEPYPSRTSHWLVQLLDAVGQRMIEQENKLKIKVEPSAELAFNLGVLSGEKPHTFTLLHSTIDNMDHLGNACFIEGHFKANVLEQEIPLPTHIADHALPDAEIHRLVAEQNATVETEVPAATKELLTRPNTLQLITSPFWKLHENPEVPTQVQIVRLGLNLINTNFQAELDVYDKYINEQAEMPDWFDYHSDFVAENSANLQKAWLEGSDWKMTIMTPGMQIRKIIQSRQAPYPITHRTPSFYSGMPDTIDLREQTARQTLHTLIGDKQYKIFLKHGHVTVRGKDNRIYRTFTGHRMTDVYENGKPVERLCVVLSGDFCPTDSLIMRILLILDDEAKFRELANVTDMRGMLPDRERVGTPEIPPAKNLPEIYKDLKARWSKVPSRIASAISA